MYFLRKQKQYVQAPSLTCTICPSEEEEEEEPQGNLPTVLGARPRGIY